MCIFCWLKAWDACRRLIIQFGALGRRWTCCSVLVVLKRHLQPHWRYLWRFLSLWRLHFSFLDSEEEFARAWLNSLSCLHWSGMIAKGSVIWSRRDLPQFCSGDFKFPFSMESLLSIICYFASFGVAISALHDIEYARLKIDTAIVLHEEWTKSRMECFHWDCFWPDTGKIHQCLPIVCCCTLLLLSSQMARGR